MINQFQNAIGNEIQCNQMSITLLAAVDHQSPITNHRSKKYRLATCRSNNIIINQIKMLKKL